MKALWNRTKSPATRPGSSVDGPRCDVCSGPKHIRSWIGLDAPVSDADMDALQADALQDTEELEASPLWQRYIAGDR